MVGPEGRPARAMAACSGHRAEPSGAKGARIPRILAPGTNRRAAVQLLRRTESDSVVGWEWPSWRTSQLAWDRGPLETEKEAPCSLTDHKNWKPLNGIPRYPRLPGTE